jgi:hypothetical protein
MGRTRWVVVLIATVGLGCSDQTDPPIDAAGGGIGDDDGDDDDGDDSPSLDAAEPDAVSVYDAAPPDSGLDAGPDAGPVDYPYSSSRSGSSPSTT